MPESISESDSKPEMAKLEIAKGPDAELTAGGLRFVACRREVGEIDGGITLYVWSEEEPELELIRMDLFRNRPHYHAPATNDAETKIDRGDQAIEAWGVETVTRRAEQLATEAGHAELGARLSDEALTQAAPELAAMLAGLGDPTEISYFELPQAVLDGLAAS